MSGAIKKILYAESDRWLRQRIVMEMEAEADIEIYETDSGEEALKLLKKKKDFDLVISAFHLKDKHGDYLYSETRKFSPNTPYILHTTVFDVDVLPSINEGDSSLANAKSRLSLQRPVQ